MCAGSSALLRLFFPSFIHFLLFLVQFQNTVDIGFGRQQLFHFLAGFSVFGVGRFLLRQQLGVLGIQRLDGGQLLEAKPIKIVLCGLVDRDLAFMYLLNVYSVFKVREVFPSLPNWELFSEITKRIFKKFFRPPFRDKESPYHITEM